MMEDARSKGNRLAKEASLAIQSAMRAFNDHKWLVAADVTLAASKAIGRLHEHSKQMVIQQARDMNTYRK